MGWIILPLNGFSGEEQSYPVNVELEGSFEWHATVCHSSPWQGDVCSIKIQGDPAKLSRKEQWAEIAR